MNYTEQLLEKLQNFKICDKDKGETKPASVIVNRPENDQLCASVINRIIQVSDDYVRSQKQANQQLQQTKAASITRNSRPMINEIVQLRKFLFNKH